MKPIIPFSMLPPRALMGIAKNYGAAGVAVVARFPGLKMDLIRAEIEVVPVEYAAACLFSAALNAVLLFFAIMLVGYAASIPMGGYAVVASIVVGAGLFMTGIYYPRIISTQKVRKLEDHLVPVVRQLVIELRSGVPLFQAMTSVCDDYGDVSVEFTKIVKKINAGESELDVLSEAARRIPSPQLQKVLWQISNALKVGSDVSTALEGILADLTSEKINEIKRYAQELSPWTMIYMMAAIIVPSLGMTIGIVLLSFLSVSIPKFVFPVIILILAGFQVFFLNFLGTRRPSI
jgi:flagellar protein FlaJ